MNLGRRTAEGGCPHTGFSMDTGFPMYMGFSRHMGFSN
jgi:hypothetical protein